MKTPPAFPADFFTLSTDAVARIITANTSISFNHLSSPDYPDLDLDAFLHMLDAIRLMVPSLLAFIRSFSSVAALALDLFYVDALEAATATGVLAYFYYAFATVDLVAFLLSSTPSPPHTATSRTWGRRPLHFPGVPLILTSDMPHIVLNHVDRTRAA
ncbi:hypothetical protein ABZP36_028915 [Zizania latifolia]